MSALLLCALHRLGKPSTAAAVLDRATALAIDADWPRRHYPGSVHHVSAALRNMAKASMVVQDSHTIDDGKSRPLYRVTGEFNFNYPMPPVPRDGPGDSPLSPLSPPQLTALFDVLTTLLHESGRQRRDLERFLIGQHTELERQLERANARLVAAGLDKVQA